MKIKMTATNHDHSGPVIDIQSESAEEAFDIGVLAAELLGVNACIWILSHKQPAIRIPLVLADEIGLAITYKKESEGV